MYNVKRTSSLNVVTVVDGELFINGVSAGLPTMAQLNAKQDEIIFIKLTSTGGILPVEVLGLLNKA